MRKRGYKVSPQSEKGIVERAVQIREMVKGLCKGNFVMIIHLLEVLHYNDVLYLEVCDDSEAERKGEAFFNPSTRTITLPDSVYCAVCEGQGRARFTVAHEIAHFFLGHSLVFGRNGDSDWKPYVDSEWQADTFASAFLAPPYLIDIHKSADQIASEFGLSIQAAKIALEKTKKARPKA